MKAGIITLVLLAAIGTLILTSCAILDGVKQVNNIETESRQHETNLHRN